MAKEVYVILDNIRSAFNVGSIFRTSDAAGITKLFLCGITPYPPHIKLQKTALGALETVSWEYAPSTIDAITQMKEQQIPVISVELDARAIPYNAYQYPDRCALVLGHELVGVDAPILNISDAIVQIPMRGQKNSLNVAVSYGIVVYQATT